MLSNKGQCLVQDQQRSVLCVIILAQTEIEETQVNLGFIRYSHSSKQCIIKPQYPERDHQTYPMQCNHRSSSYMVTRSSARGYDLASLILTSFFPKAFSSK